jgi:hypothetical protein
MSDKKFPNSDLPIRKTSELLPKVFQTPANEKFMAGVLDPLVQPGVLEKTVGYIGRRYGKTYKGSDVYLDSDNTLRSRYQLEPGVVVTENNKISKFYDYIDFKNQLRFFGNTEERDDLVTAQEHYAWNPPIDWDKFVNFREYYWVPEGPPAITITGQAQNIVSGYTVRLGNNSTYVFTPDGYTVNPTLTLYRGQTYKFNVNAPTDGLVFRSVYDSGSPFQSPIEYKKGVTNNGTENGVITFTVPFDAPDMIYYQSKVDVNRLGRFMISDVESNTKINIEKEILGKPTYTSSNDIVLSNGMNVRFTGMVTPEKYASDTWIVEGVGSAIHLVRLQDLVVSPALNANVPEVLFDNAGFDADPFDDATAYPLSKDYVLINRASPDNNPWSRYNRWFHRSVLEQAHAFNNSSFESTEETRAKRPIIEFNIGIQLYNHGSIAKATVDYVDTFTTDVFSKIEGSLGYNVDGEQLFEGARLLVINDSDSLVNNKIYKVTFITHNNTKQISLRETEDSVSSIGEGVLVRRGNVNKSLMYHFSGTAWVKSQEKTAINQAPMIDAFDKNGVSFSDTDTYPVSSFKGTELVSYKKGVSVVDSELGFSLSYLNIDNVGDIEFEFDWDKDTFTYQNQQFVLSKKVNSGFFKFNPAGEYDNGWKKSAEKYIQAIIDSQIISAPTSTVQFNTVDWNTDKALEIYFYINGKKYTGEFSRAGSNFTLGQTLAANDVVVIKVFGDIIPNQGYYEIPVGLEKNPLNSNLLEFTLGTASDHVSTAIEFNNEFIGSYPGNSNLRDLSPYITHGKRFLKHAGIPSVAISLLCDKDVNLIKSLQFSKKSYTEFKNNFVKLSTTLYYNQTPADFVDDILSEMARTKTSITPFSDTDMVGSGAHTKIEYTVEDTGIKTFALSSKFSLDTLSRKAVYVYLNDVQLLVNTQYEFNSSFGFVQLKVDLQEGDRIEIREYASTAYNFIPATPTKLGLYKKYTPMIFVDNTYVTPRTMIQGHDGSLTTAYGDFRDNVILELEYRIYNNIKQEYNEEVFDIDKVLGGYYGSGFYNKEQLDLIVNREFLKWIADTNIDYINNQYFDSENPFTYTYSRMYDLAGSTNLPGYWRGVYKWFYDTDRPHRCPWEMLGFSEKPAWWESEYGVAPYTSNNMLLWEDLRDGVIRQGSRAGVHQRYKRETLLSHIPVDADGNLLNPLDAGLAQGFSLVNSKGDFKLGDIAPVEHAWRSSSEWPFAIIIAMSLMKPFEFITDSLDRSKTTTNILAQTVSTSTDLFLTLSDISVPTVTGLQTTGLINYIADYLKNKNLNDSAITNILQNIDVKLTSRLSGFVDQQQQKYILDSKNPRATSSSVFVPPENYDIIFNVSSPISFISYSGVIFEKTENGWKINGYDNAEPFFTYFEPVPSQVDPLMRVGGVSESFYEWTAEKFYGNGVIVRYNNEYYRSLKSHTSETTFTNTSWKKLPSLPLTGGVEAFKRRTFNTLRTKQLTYGTILTTIQEVVDFLLGYEVYLKSVGLLFDGYDSETQTAKDWTTACKEFMFWTKHNWEAGSLLTLSPSANKIEISLSVGVADNVLDSFYDYQILKSDGTPLAPAYINVTRDFQKFYLETTNTLEGIYYLKVYFVLKEHVAIFDDRTVFNDVIYDKTTGYRQERIKTRGFRTVDWDGDYTSPGFLFDNVRINSWQPFVDYNLGDIVSYKSYNWVSNFNQTGTEEFDNEKWSKLDSTPTKSLVPNFDYRINQFEDYFDLDAYGLGSSQRDLARHAIGYQTRDYLQELAEDEVSQFKLYQGFIREKGTSNSVVKVFDKLSRTTDDSIVLNEEWAFRVGRLGGTDQLREIEFRIVKDKLEINPQPMLVLPTVYSGSIVDQYLRINPTDFTVADTPFTAEINPVALYDGQNRSAGYVKTDQINFTVRTRDDILDLNIYSFVENDSVWVTFDGPSWSVIRYNESPVLSVESFEKSGTTVTINTNRSHTLAVGDIIGLKDVINLTGFFKLTDIGFRTLTVEVAEGVENPEFDSSTTVNIHMFTNARFGSYQDVDPRQVALLKYGSKLWIDSNEDNLWEVVEKTQQFSVKDLADYGTSTPEQTGYAIKYIDSLKQIISSMPRQGFVMSYVETSAGLGLRQIIAPSSDYTSKIAYSFGKSLDVTPDAKFMVVGSPDAGYITSTFRGDFDFSGQYFIGETVLFEGRLWTAVNDVVGDGSSINVYNQDWKLETLLVGNPIGRGVGYGNQGMVTIFKWQDQQWTEDLTIISPRPSDGEHFGHKVTLAQSGSTYYMAVSAPGSQDSRGRVYLYIYENSQWRHLESTAYQGLYTNGEFYPADTIVWSNGSLWEATSDVTGTSGGLIVDSLSWTKLDPIATSCSLPKNVTVDDDGSTLESGMLSGTDLSELTKQGDQFGSVMSMNRDGSILVVGVPLSDDQYFANYRGDWKLWETYTEGDVIRYYDPAEGYWTYHKLVDPREDVEDSSIVYTNTGTEPVGSPWENVGDSTVKTTGKVYVYQRDANKRYSLKQTISAGSLVDINDLGTTETISSGDEFGYSLDIDSTGTTIVVSSPEADINGQNQGSVYIFKTTDFTNLSYRLKQKIESFENFTNEFFGSSVSISAGTERVIVGAKNAPYKLVTRFDTGLGTYFDQGKTVFSESQGYPGQVYVFERKDQQYMLVEKLQAELINNESFGFSVDCTSSVVVVGSPTYKQEDVLVGRIRLFKKSTTENSLKTLSNQTDLVDISKLKTISLYDPQKNVKISDIDIVDHFKMKVLGIAEQEIKFKTMYDPAIYNVGTEDQVVDNSQTWFEKHVGELWWDLNTVKWINYEQGDISYRAGNWNSLAFGASVDIYEWVETPLLPSEWSLIADSVEGLVNGISGQPLYTDDTVYCVKEIYNTSTGLTTGTLYYYWVKNKKILPTDVTGRKLAATEVAALIESPASSGTPFIAFIDKDKFLAYNFDSLISADTALMNIQYLKNTKPLNLIHNEYQLLTEAQADSLPSASLETKWIDSLVGFDLTGNTVPDTKLPAKQKYGLGFRPRQSMFVDRLKVLKVVVENVNSILMTQPFADTVDYKNLNLVDTAPVAELREYDLAVDSYIDLTQVGTIRIKQAVLTPNIVDGKIDTIDITDPGFGYRVVPTIKIEGTGYGATAVATLDTQGRISSVTVLQKGKKYSSAIAKIRPFSVLINSDETSNNYWTIYAWDQQRKIFYRSKSQGYDTTRYWEYADWWATGYSSSTRVNKEITEFYLESTLTLHVGDLIRVKEFTNGGWAVLERTEEGAGTLLGKYILIGRENGTIQLKNTLYNSSTSSIGFDNVSSYDAAFYDLQPTVELRNILRAIKEDIFVNNLRVEWNKLFFTCIRYAFSEQLYIDWAFKTSFLNAVHNVGDLEQRTNYKNDNLDAFRQYLAEVKPYRTSIREYTSRYTEIQTTNSSVTDFDSPPVYSTEYGTILPVNESYDRFNEYPWKWFADNQGYSITSIEVAEVGAGYTSAPTVIIEGNGIGAQAKAYISSGKISGIVILNEGSGYTQTPVVTLVGGNGAGNAVAKAVAILGKGKIRNFNISVKFDRISKEGIYQNLSQTQTFTATGQSSVINLNYAPTQDKSKIIILKNSQPVLNSEYTISLYKSSVDTYSLLKGKITFKTPPEKGDVIEVTYEKNDSLLDSINRIEKYYAPKPGMKGKEMNQLMTGIDFGGVQIQGTTFDVTGGWDALPWFTDGWDGVESNADHYVVTDGSTTTVTLPSAPAVDQMITVYIKRAGEQRATRIDDPYYGMYDGSTIQPNGKVEAPLTAVMPTFIGNGVTREVEIGQYVRTYSGDTLIFRPIESDGSVTINDVNLLDTRLSGGSLSAIDNAYVSATGLLAEDINVDGGKFSSPDYVPATEENIPGQVLDSVSIKVFTSSVSGATPLQTKIYTANGTTTSFAIGLKVLEAQSVIVYVDKIKQTDYSLDFINNVVDFTTAPAERQLVEIISIGIGGVEILDYQEYVADGETSLFLTKAKYNQTQSVVVTVDGVMIDLGFIESTGIVDQIGMTLIQFGIKPSRRQVVKIICLGVALDTDSGGQSIIRINQQQLTFEGSTRSFDLDKFVTLSRGSTQPSMVVEVNGRALVGVDTSYRVYDGTNNRIVVGVDPEEAVGTITSGNIKVFLNGRLLRFVIEYTYDGNQNTIEVPSTSLEIGDIIKVESDVRAEYYVDGSNLVISDLVTLVDEDIIDVTWFSEYPTMDLISDEFTGGKVQYQLARTPLSVSYVWVYKNGERLTQDQEYYISLQRRAVYLTIPTTTDDKIKIVQFSSDVFALPSAYEIYKDMLNVYHYKRYSKNSVVLTKDLYYYDQQIEVSDGSILATPVKNRNIPGVVTINGERIEYLEKSGNILSQLRRGSLGTAIGDVYTVGVAVVDVGYKDTIPYSESQDKLDFISDGSSLLVGPLEFTPQQGSRSTWYRSSIPVEYGACDTLEVFVAGRRLRKNPMDVYDEELGAGSPSADVQVEAEFSVDGLNPYIRLTSAPAAGTRITVIRKTGQVWYEKGAATITTGKTLLENNTSIARFIVAKTTDLPE